MADSSSRVTPSEDLRFESGRVAAFVKTLEAMATGEVDARLPVSPRHDELDAIAHGINVLVGELGWVHARVREAQEAKAAELELAVATAEARNSALIKAVPDLMFVLQRDGTFVDYQVRDPRLLFVPPAVFLGRTVRDVMPPPLAEVLMSAIERASQSDEPVVVEYDLPLPDPHFFEARLVQAGGDRVLVIIRDITEARRASELNRDLARRLIMRQEGERQRIARELHDDVSQSLAMLSVEIDQLAAQAGAEPVRARLDRLSAQVREIAGAVHDVSYELHPSRLRAVGLVGAIRALCDDASQQPDLIVTFGHGDIPPAVDAEVSLCVYRIVQEALHNVARHSQARDAQVTLTYEDGHLALRVADSGVGFDTAQLPRGSLGLVSMQERVAFLKGQLAIDAAPRQGTRISVRIPLASQPAGSPATPPGVEIA